MIPFQIPVHLYNSSREWESRVRHCRDKKQRGETKSDTKPTWGGLETQQDALSAPEEQQTPSGVTALQGHDPQGLGRSKLQAQGTSGEGLSHAREQPACAQHPPAAGRQGQIPAFITGNTDDSLGGAILTACQKQITVAHGGMGKVSLPP